MTAVVDTGLQAERTLLAWRRTCLTLAVGLALAIRYSEILDPAVALWIGLPALALTVAAYAATSARYRTAARALVSGAPAADAGGRAVAAVSLVTLLLGVAALGFVLVGQGAPW